MRIFESSGLTVSGKVLPRENFVPFAFFRETELCPERMGAIVKAAERALEEPLLALSLSRYRDFYVDGNRTRFEEEYFKRRNRFVNLFYAELYEGKGRFFEALMDTTWAILEETTWLLPAHNKHNPIAEDGIPSTYGGRAYGVALFAASTGAYLAFLYYCMKDRINAFAPELARRICYEVHERLTVPFLTLKFGWSGEAGNRPNNWNPWISSEVLLATALISEDMQEREAVLARALYYGDYFVNGYGVDGGCDEGPGYWGAAGLAYITLLSIAKDMTGGEIDLLAHPLVKSIGEYVVKVHVADEYFINNADCALRPGVSGSLLRICGECIGSRVMEEMGCCFDIKAPIQGLGVINPYLTYLKLCLPLPKEEPSVQAPLSVYFRDLKIALMRECENESVGLCMAMKGGTNGESHNHNDMGQIYLYKDGKPVIVDMGGMTYTKKTFSPERYTIMAMRSIYHSTVTVAGYEQCPGSQYATAEEHFDADARTVSMQLKNAYPTKAGILDLTRCATLSGEGLTVTDYVALENEGEIDIHYLTAEEPIKNPDGTFTLAEGVTLVAPQQMTCRIEPIALEDGNLQANWKRPYLYMMHFTKTTKTGSFTFCFCK